MNRLIPCVLALGIVSCSAPAETPTDAPMDPPQATVTSAPDNVLTDQERADGWVLLFDGQSFAGWRGLGRDDVPGAHWVVEDGTIRKMASGNVETAPDGQPLEGGDIMTVEAYENFELRFDWKVAPGANSGIKYNVSEAMSTAEPPSYAALGFEYQVLDDDLHPDALVGPNRRAAGLYDVIGPGDAKHLRPVGEFNQARIVVDGSHGEHWLNSDRVVEYDLESDEFRELLAASKYEPIDGFADKRIGHIVLQDHGDDVWYRNIKVRTLQGAK